MTWGKILIAVCILAFTSTIAAQELTLEYEITLAELDNAPALLDFADIDGDAYPEMLVSDSSSVVLYSVTGDSIIFRLNAAPAPVVHQLKIGDVNRDHVPDLLIVSSIVGLFPEHHYTCFDGASNFTATRDTILSAEFFSGVAGIEGTMFGDMLISDIDNDGYCETLIGLQESQLYPYIQEYLTGRTLLFSSFPDDFRGEDDKLIVSSYTQQRSPYVQKIMGEYSGLNAQYFDGTRIEDYRYWSIIRADGTETYYFDQLEPVTCSGGLGHDYSDVRDQVQPLTVVPFSNSAIMPAMFAHRECYCYFIDLSTYETECCYDTINQLIGYQFDSLGVRTTAWTLDNPRKYTSGAYHPDYEDVFFAVTQDSVFGLEATSGLDRAEGHELPTHDLAWFEQDFGDNYPRLITTNGSSIDIYTLAFPTDVPEPLDIATLPESFTLSEPYPNPFNPEVTVMLSLKEPSHVNAVVYNVQGQRVVTLIDELMASGEQPLTWHAQSYASGVYHFRVTVGDQVKSVKAVLLK